MYIFLYFLVMSFLFYDKSLFIDIREEFVRLLWLSVYILILLFEGRNVKYVIEVRELLGFDWYKVVIGIYGNIYMVKNLKFRVEYVFRVYVENQFGVSDFI